jgi:hypothetical protein
MATYEDIYGKRVKEFDSDPTLDSNYEGQVWYNSATGTLKSVVAFAAWSSTTALPAGKYYGSGAGEKDSTLVFAGLSSAPTLDTSSSEYNGSGWMTEGSINTGRRSTGGTGTSTAALCVGGFPDPVGNKTEEYDGSSWTETGNVPRQGHGMGVFGIQTAAYACGGGTSGNTTTVDVYNGSSWTSGTSLSTARFAAQGAGTTSAGLIFGGAPDFSAGSTATESWDGSSWTTLANMNTGRTDFAGGGTQTAALGWAGRQSGPTDSVKTESWDGTSWTEVADYPTGTNAPQGSSGPATSTAATAAGGAAPGPVATANEFSKSINTITAAAWASGGNLGTARRQVGGFGHTTTTAVCACGQNPPGLSNVEEYNGSSWSEVNNAPMARVKPFACGVLTAGLIGGGEEGPSPASYQSSAEYDGTNWTASPSSALGQNVNSGTALGIQTAALLVVGSESPNTAVKYYDGSSWTAGPAATPTSMASASGNGTQTNGLVYGNSPSQTTTLEWDGSSWTSGGALTSGRDRGAEAVGAPSTAALYFGGNNPSSTELTATEGYDGTSWSSRPNMATARRGLGGAGVNTLSLAFGGYTGSDTAATEEFTGVTETVTSKTLTTG